MHNKTRVFCKEYRYNLKMAYSFSKSLLKNYNDIPAMRVTTVLCRTSGAAATAVAYTRGDDGGNRKYLEAHRIAWPSVYNKRAAVVHARIRKRSVYRSLDEGYIYAERAVSLVPSDHTYTVGQRYHGYRGHINAKMCTHTHITRDARIIYIHVSQCPR